MHRIHHIGQLKKRHFLLTVWVFFLIQEELKKNSDLSCCNLGLKRICSTVRGGSNRLIYVMLYNFHRKYFSFNFRFERMHLNVMTGRQ